MEEKFELTYVNQHNIIAQKPQFSQSIYYLDGVGPVDNRPSSE